MRAVAAVLRRGDGGAPRGRALALATALALAGCTLLTLREEAAEVEASTVLAGRIECPADPAQALVVAALSAASDAPPVLRHHARLHACGGYELVAPPGPHRVVAFADRNGNGRHDPGEPLVETPPVTVQRVGVQLLDAVALPAAGGVAADERAAALGLQRLAPLPHSTQAGALLSWGDAALAPDQGALGYWAPMSYFRRHGGNVYALEPWDPQRVPVLFVHGAAGTPADLRPLIERLDRTRFQAWVYAYPSGASVESMAHLLYWKLLNLQLQLRFRSWVLVAHSMGGLVARSTLASLAGELPPPRLFVSLSTPWGGEPGAELGVRHSPAVVPSWHDMRPEGAFMAALFTRPLPAETSHVLLFGHRGGPSLVRPNTDGTVTLASQLRPEAQAGARRVVGFDEDHMSILSAVPVHRMLASLLDAAVAGTSAPQGEVQVSFEGAGAAQAFDALPMLRLRPLDGGGAAITLVLGPADAARALGPVAPGRYEAGLLVAGQGVEPARQPLEVAAGRIAPLRVRLQPEGGLSGYVATAPRTIAAGARLLPADTVRVRRVVLTAPGWRRELRPRPGPPDAAALDRLIDGHDDAVGAQFAFRRLPAGEVELAIEAEGHAPHRSRHVVQPGRPGVLAPIVLQPLPAR